MSNELRDAIITTKAAERMLNRVSPIYDDSYVGLWLFEALGREYGSYRDLIESLKNELFPETATWSIGMWERRYGIKTDEKLTIEERRFAVEEAQRALHKSNKTKLETWIARKTGCDVTIIDHVAAYTFGIKITDSHGNAIGIDKLVEGINSKKPSHLSYQFDMEDVRTANAYYGLILYGAATIDVGTAIMPEIDTDECLTDELENMLMDEFGVIMIE